MKDYEATEIAYKNGYAQGLKDAVKHGTGGLKMHKCDTCQYKGEHQEMGFRAVGVCTMEKNLLKAIHAYKAPECPFAVKEGTQHGKQMRLIDADVLWNKAEEMYIHTKSGKIIPVMAVPTWAINNAPTIEAEPVRHGKWIVQDETYTRYFCSECKSGNHQGHEKFCPNCGAKMDLEV